MMTQTFQLGRRISDETVRGDEGEGDLGGKERSTI